MLCLWGDDDGNGLRLVGAVQVGDRERDVESDGRAAGVFEYVRWF